MEREYHGCGDGTRKKGKGKQYHLTYNIQAVGKNIKWGEAEGDGHFLEENQDLKNNEIWKNIKLQGMLYTPVFSS